MVVSDPGDVITYCFWWKSAMLMSVKPEVELIFYHCFYGKIVRYLENGERYACVTLNSKLFGSVAWF